jgi:hypothetical protein
MAKREIWRERVKRLTAPFARPILRKVIRPLWTRFRPIPRIRFRTENDCKRPSPFGGLIDKENVLEQLGRKYQPTKHLHNYLQHYWAHFRDIRLQVRSVLEIGVETDRSIMMWEEFFPHATIYGLDINPGCKEYEGGRRKIIVGDQYSPEVLSSLVRAVPTGFDVIIDDGSHQVTHQLRTFSFLFPALTEHGVYVIEDTGGCVGDYGLRTVSRLKDLVGEIMFWPTGFAAEGSARLEQLPVEGHWAARNITGIAFYRWIVFIVRGRNPDDNPYLV